MVSAAIYRITLKISTKYYKSLGLTNYHIEFIVIHVHINKKLVNINLSRKILTKDDKCRISIDLQPIWCGNSTYTMMKGYHRKL